jgi:hypothetical protein
MRGKPSELVSTFAGKMSRYNPLSKKIASTESLSAIKGLSPLFHTLPSVFPCDLVLSWRWLLRRPWLRNRQGNTGRTWLRRDLILGWDWA